MNASNAAADTPPARLASREGSRLRDRWRYRIDNRLSRGVTPVIGLLAGATVLVVLLAGFSIWVAKVRVNGQTAGGVEGVWMSLLRTLDPGTMGSDQGWPLRVTSLAVTVTGILIVSTLIGLLANGIDTRLEELRRGQSAVVEKGHTLVLGWSPKLYLLIRELAAAAEPPAKPCVVVLAERDNVEMLNELRDALSDDLGVRVVTRSGSPASPAALGRVALHEARSVVVLKEHGREDADAIRSVLALELAGLPGHVPVILELQDARHEGAIRLASRLNVHAIVPEPWIANITARALRQPTLVPVYEDLLDFDGCEIYPIAVDPSLVGRPLAEAVAAMDGCLTFGLHRDGHAVLAPPPGTTIVDGDRLLVIAETASAARLRREPIDVTWSHAAPNVRDREQPDLIGVIGWSELGAGVLKLLDQSLPPGSMIHALVDADDEAFLPSQPFQRFELRHTTGDTTDPDVLSRFIERGQFDRMLLLSGREGRSLADRDARVLLTTLELRHLLDPGHSIEITVEMSDPLNVQLVRGDDREEFIVGERLVSLLLTQVSQNHELAEVLRILLVPEGPELAMVGVECVLPVGESATVGAIAQALLGVGSYLIGVHAGRVTTLNPDQRAVFTARTGDEFIVIRHSD